MFTPGKDFRRNIVVHALLAFFTLKEPRRFIAQHASQVAAASATFSQTVA